MTKNICTYVAFIIPNFSNISKTTKQRRCSLLFQNPGHQIYRDIEPHLVNSHQITQATPGESIYRLTRWLSGWNNTGKIKTKPHNWIENYTVYFLVKAACVQKHCVMQDETLLNTKNNYELRIIIAMYISRHFIKNIFFSYKIDLSVK